MFVRDSPGDDLCRAARRRGRACASLPARRAAARAHAALRRRRQLEGDRRELQRVLPLRPGPPGAVHARSGVPARRRWARVARRDPPPRGGVDVHDDRDVAAPTVRRARRGRAHPAQGRADLSQPAAQPQRRTRRGVSSSSPAEPAHTTVGCDLLFHPDELASPSFDPSDAGDLWDLVNRQDWAICESVQRGMTSRGWTGGWFAPMEDDSADIARWYRRLMGETSERRASASTAGTAWRLTRSRVVGLGGLGAAAVYWLARRRLGRRLRAVRARSRARRLARPLAHHPAVLPHARLRAAHGRGVRRLGGGRSDAATHARHATGGVDLFPPGAAIDPDSYGRASTRSAWRSSCSTVPRCAAMAGVRGGTAVTDDVLAIYRRTPASCRPTGRPPRCTALAVEHGAELRPNAPCAGCGRSAAGSTS